ncbi:MAG: UMP kinase [Kiritimatiellaeota bacterium]|nr:UMP kinase [Kiritimatiellota bacterium]
MKRLKYRRILLKLSGEVLLNRETGHCIDPGVLGLMAERIGNVVEMGAEVVVVLGGGNIFRGLGGATTGIGRTTGDYMGMLATVINALALQSALEGKGIQTRVQSAISMHEVAEPYIHRRAMRHLEKGRVVIIAAGTGNPYFSTDTAAALRASEVGADVLLKATKVDGIYTADPVKDAKARRYAKLTYRDALTQNLRVMDSSAFALCMENKIAIIVFDFFQKDQLEKAILGKPVGTLVSDFDKSKLYD